jgi:hypothetical protein
MLSGVAAIASFAIGGAAAGLWAGPADVTVPAHPPQPIVGGEPTAPGEFDGVVAVVAGQGLCTGTVVAPRLIVTAGHCLLDLPDAAQISVYFGDELDPDMSVPAQSWATHPNFCKTCEEDIFDYGYVTLGTDFEVPGGFTLPIVTQAQWNAMMYEGADVTIVGYGEDPEVFDSIGVKRKVTTQIRRFTPEGFEFFAGGDHRDSCQGDSGGPAFVRLEGVTWRLAGITSRGSSPCGDGGFYGVPYPALVWIRDETGVDLLDPACPSGDCLDTAPPDDDSCSVGARRPPAWSLLPWIAIALRRRRRIARCG